MPSPSPHSIASGITLTVQVVAAVAGVAALLVSAALCSREVRRQAGIAGYVLALALSLLALVTAYAAR
ncbi:hypothetical protein [Streptomyces sp. NPDC001401]|uniref:hypothetical protein n=1 Tax=Streptomyces sp. NPDC001401 TaxID=3364570 RepID=UPI0036B223AA